MSLYFCCNNFVSLSLRRFLVSFKLKNWKIARYYLHPPTQNLLKNHSQIVAKYNFNRF